MPTNPELLKMPFAQDGDKNSIPETTSPTTGLFSQQYGFQNINSLPLTAGGKAISRLDYNGAMYMLSNLLYYMQRGYTFVYDNTMPYVVGCRVLDPNDGQVYNCVADVAAGTGAPSVTPANWELAPSVDLLGYRQPDTEYEVGGIAFNPDLPTGYYLECTTAGTTGSGALTIGTTTMGTTVSDGTVTWTISKDLSVFGGQLLGIGIQRNVNDSFLRLNGGINSGSGAFLQLNGKDEPTNPCMFDLMAADGVSTTTRLRGFPNGNLTWNGNDLAGSAIVAKSLSANGYIKYASGLIIAWHTSGGSQPITISNKVWQGTDSSNRTLIIGY